MNGHPRAPMKLILRQYEAEVNISNSRWFPASNYRSKWSNIAGQGSKMKKMSEKSICETPAKIYNSRWFPASIYRSKWSNIAGQGSNMKKMSKKSIFRILFLIFYIDPGGPGGHPGGSRTHPGAQDPSNISIFQKKLKNR